MQDLPKEEPTEQNILDSSGPNHFFPSSIVDILRDNSALRENASMRQD